MKKLIGVLLFGFIMVRVCATPLPVNQIAAVVNDEAITTAQVSKQVTLIKLRAKESGQASNLPPDNVLQQQILQQLINRALQLQIAARANLHVSPEQINQAVARIAAQNHTSARQLYQQMEKSGFTVQSFRNEVREEILLQMVQGQEVAARISLSPGEVDDVLARLQQQRVAYHVGDILIALPDTPSPAQIAQAQAKAEKIMAELKQGAKFSELAMANSGGADALKGGDLGWRKLAELPNEFATRVVALNPGEVAGPIRAANGFHIIKLYGVRHAALPTSNAAQRKEVEQMLFQTRFQQGLMTWLQQLRASAYIKIYQ